MITITVDDKAVKQMIADLPNKASRAAERAIDATVREIKKEVITTMKSVFDRPTPFTLNSLQLTLTQNHNMMAKVWFKDPARMHQHYLVPQVDGGLRRSKGLELALGMQFTPADELGFAKMDQYGNVKSGQVKQIMSRLGALTKSAGSSGNATTKSLKGGKERDYVLIRNRKTNLAPGIYQRVATTRSVRGRYSDLSARKTGRAGGANAWQTGTRKAVVRARGLAPVMFQATPKPVRPLLDFYGIANKTYSQNFTKFFHKFFSAVRR
ncbi:MAG: hypothetical protein J0652_02690 [Desulfobulbaceae bacterium]|nr:hypothetical protein [Desulfobulbaceae bacterium]